MSSKKQLTHTKITVKLFFEGRIRIYVDNVNTPKVVPIAPFVHLLWESFENSYKLTNTYSTIWSGFNCEKYKKCISIVTNSLNYLLCAVIHRCNLPSDCRTIDILPNWWGSAKRDITHRTATVVYIYVSDCRKSQLFGKSSTDLTFLWPTETTSAQASNPNSILVTTARHQLRDWLFLLYHCRRQIQCMVRIYQ